MDVPLLQSYLQDRFGESSAKLGHVIEVGLEEVIAYLMEKEMAHAAILLQHMVREKTRDGRQFSAYRETEAARRVRE